LNYLSLIREKFYHFMPNIKGYQFNYYTLLSKSASLMIQRISVLTMEMYPPDIRINIPVNSYGPFHFYKSDEIIKTGEMATRKALLEFLVKK